MTPPASALAGKGGRRRSTPGIYAQRMPSDLRHLRLAALLLQESSLTKVARRLGVTQPTASRLLCELEEHLQVRLAERSPQGVRLTTYGHRVAERAAAVVADVDELLSPRQPVPAAGPLVCFAWNRLEYALSAAMTAWQEEYPQSPCRLRQSETPADDVLTHRADVALVRGGVVLPGLAGCTLYEEDRLAALPISSPFADYAAISLEDLAQLELVINTTSGTTQAVMWPPGHQPSQCLEVSGFEEWVTSVAASSKRFSLTPQSTPQYYTNPHLRFVRVLDVPPVPTRLIWRERESRVAIKHFIDLVKAAA